MVFVILKSLKVFVANSSRSVELVLLLLNDVFSDLFFHPVQISFEKADHSLATIEFIDDLVTFLKQSSADHGVEVLVLVGHSSLKFTYFAVLLVDDAQVMFFL
jgi:hypothetical protein